MKPSTMLIDDAYKTLIQAKNGNLVAFNAFNEWASGYCVPGLPNEMWDQVNSYDDFWVTVSIANFID